MSSYAFHCKTLKPWDEVESGFTNAAGLKLWLDYIYGEYHPYSQLKEVRAWIETAQGGDTVYLNDDFKLVAPEFADVEVRCNRYPSNWTVKAE